MYIRSIAFASLVMGVLFKTLHWPGANIVLLAGTVLSLVTLLVLLIKKPGPWSIRIARPVWPMGALVLVLIGSMFKAMHWPGANVLLLIGLTTCAAWFLIQQPKPLAPPQ